MISGIIEGTIFFIRKSWKWFKRLMTPGKRKKSTTEKKANKHSKTAKTENQNAANKQNRIDNRNRNNNPNVEPDTSSVIQS